MKSGFTIIELMATIVIISIGVLGTYSVVQQMIRVTSSASQRLTAAYLAQEGIELIRNVRDTNWIRDLDWNAGLATGDWEVDYNDFSLSAYANRNLKINNNLYNYDSGTNTIYKRKITLSNNGADSLKILSEISWTYGGISQSLSAEENIYDWK